MPPPRAPFADRIHPAASSEPALADEGKQGAEAVATSLRRFLAEHPQAAVLEDGKVIFELASARHDVVLEGDRCTLQLWSGERNLVRTVVAAVERSGSLRLSTARLGRPGTKLLQIAPKIPRRTVATREPARKAYLGLLERVVRREFPEWTPEAFRTAMDLERSFGPAYARGSLVRGNEAWAVIGVGAAESQAVVDGILTLGILWLHTCRERGDGRRLYKGLRVIAPRGAATLTLSRLPWMNAAAAQWELFELDERTEELIPCDPADQGNLRTRLVHLPDEAAARERFAEAIDRVMRLVPGGEEARVEQRLRSTAELAFLLHGLEFARARLSLAHGSFRHLLEITAGCGGATTPLNESTEGAVRRHLAELFRRRDGRVAERGRQLRARDRGRAIGAFTGAPAHSRTAVRPSPGGLGVPTATPLQRRQERIAPGSDPLFRAAPERWLESVLRENLAPLTRALAPLARGRPQGVEDRFANDPDPDTRGNRADVETAQIWDGQPARAARRDDRILPHLHPRFVYTQVPAIAGASDRGMLDLLGVTADGRLAVIELKAADDLQLSLQGLDYWVRVRHHHGQTTDASTGSPGAGNDLQRHGYFRGLELSPLPPRLYLVAPALHVHPATETVLRYLSPRVEWTLLALDERWRTEVRVVWRRSGGKAEKSSSQPLAESISQQRPASGLQRC